MTTHYPSVPVLNWTGNFVNLFWENNDYVFLESSTDLDTWTTLGNSSPYADPVASQKFYRTKVIVD